MMIGYRVLTATAHDVTIDHKDALSYMGCSCDTGASVLDLLYATERLLVPALSYRAVGALLPLKVKENRVTVGEFSFESEDLAVHLKGCTSCCLFAATVGVGADRIIAATSHRSSACSAMADALASAAVEAWCDLAEKKLTEGKKCRPRYSPGYGDWQLSAQRQILRLLDADRKIGLSITEALMLTPTKSVTALVGIES